MTQCHVKLYDMKQLCFRDDKSILKLLIVSLNGALTVLNDSPYLFSGFPDFHHIFHISDMCQ